MSDAEQLINRISAYLEDLRREYLLFLNDSIQLEPLTKKDALLAMTRRLRVMPGLRTSEKFRSENLIAKVLTNTQLWEKQAERKYEGNPRLRAMRARKMTEDARADAERAEENAAQSADDKQSAGTRPDKKRVVISSTDDQRDQVVKLYDEYMRLNLLIGKRKMSNFTNFQAFISAQTEKQKKKGAQQVSYEVSLKDNKVVIKSKSVD
jgi:hypothetical protein